MRLNRRAFLQQTTLALGALGLGGTTLLTTAGQYQQALAKPARRKLALLIGINNYPDRALDPGVAQDVVLKGCLTDVELQRQLLVHRFGFQPVDVVTLTNQAATRGAILAAIDDLVQQAQVDDVVVLHFSGYGSQVRVLHGGQDPGLAIAWVPVDSRLPSESNPVLGDLLEAELIESLQGLATPNLTTVIDAGSQNTGYLRWGSSRVRSRPTMPTGSLPSDLPLNLSAPWPGLLIRAAEPGGLVLESPWEGFNAGILTYALTQSLWETESPTANVLLQRIMQRTRGWVGADQQPVVINHLSSSVSAAAYGLPAQLPIAAGVVLPSSDNRPLAVWLGGVPSLVLRYLQPGSQLVATTTAGQTVPLRLESRTGLKALAKPVEASTPLLTSLGQQPVYEQVRLLPVSIDLVVALDSQLKRVERVDATSALAGIPLVTSVTAGDRAADCLFGRLPAGPTTTLTAALPGAADTMPKPNDRVTESSYGLFAPNRTLLPGTMLAKEEAVKTAVNRLTPNLQTLLALKLLRLTENRAASQLAAAAVLETVQPKRQTLLVQTTDRSGSAAWPPVIRQAQKAVTKLKPLRLARDSRIGYHLANVSNQTLHLLWMSFDSRGECTALVTLPGDTTVEGADVPEKATPLDPGKTLALPNDGPGWAMPGAATWVESYVVLSAQPLNQCLATLGGNLPTTATGFRSVAQPLQLAQALLQDLSTGDVTDTYALHHDRWVALSFRYEIT
ncbi:caspase family protein [Nodosilinea sp. LEGE 07088]|uniref:caspase family protein n=1 Tax=Nodosilinea sp. LEGE 07088 TaxID=2777968 RepID=UPI0018826968|nr:caspase family protein [Nodosilinea sp. LEGE 07088]MBE9136709.1 caspase family protein [Nodosilinea sp. LEGE 07088]